MSPKRLEEPGRCTLERRRAASRFLCSSRACAVRGSGHGSCREGLSEVLRQGRCSGLQRQGCNRRSRKLCSINTSFISPVGSPDRPAELLVGIQPTLASARGRDRLGMGGSSPLEQEEGQGIKRWVQLPRGPHRGSLGPFVGWLTSTSARGSGELWDVPLSPKKSSSSSSSSSL